MSDYTTKVTRHKTGWFCLVLRSGKPVVQALAKSREDIGPAFRDLLRTLDKGDGDAFTKASRYRQWKRGNKTGSFKHYWR